MQEKTRIRYLNQIKRYKAFARGEHHNLIVAMIQYEYLSLNMYFYLLGRARMYERRIERWNQTRPESLSERHGLAGKKPL